MGDELSCLVHALPGLIWTARLDAHLDFGNQYWCASQGLTAKAASGQAWRVGVQMNERNLNVVIEQAAALARQA